MLLNDFYQYHEMNSKGNTLSCVLSFNAAHAIFKGHFPGQPVVPGVCMIEIVEELLAANVGKELSLRNAGNVKFLQFITPGARPFVNISWKAGDNVYHVNAVFGSPDKAFFKIDAVFASL